MSYESKHGDIDRRLRRFNKHQLMVIPWKSGENPPPLEKNQIVVGFDSETHKMNIQISDGDGGPLVDGDENSLALARHRQIESLKEKLGAYLASHNPTEADHAAIQRDTLELVGHELVGRERKGIAQRIRAFAGQVVSKLWGSLKSMGSGLRRADLHFVLFLKLVFRVGLILGLFWLVLYALRPIKPSAYLPTQGSDEDRWWCAVLILTISAISASLFLLIGFTLAVVPVAARPINWRILVTVLGLGLFGLAVESTWRVVTSEDLDKKASELWKADVQAAMIRLVSEIDVQWRDANAAPIVFGERPRNSSHPLPPIGDQITAHKNRLDRWNKAAERVLKSLEKVDSIVVVAVNKTIESAVKDRREDRVSQDAAIDPPGMYILQVADAGEPEPVHGPFKKTTDKVLGGTDPAELWTVLSTDAVDQLNSAVLTELEQPRSIMLNHAAELRGRQMGAVADVLSWTARRTDRLRFRLGVHPLLEFAENPTRVNNLLLEPDAITDFLSPDLFDS